MATAGQRRARRPYDSTRRRRQAAETGERILAAGSELVHASPVRDWRALTVRAVAERAGVSERTVYRRFVNERGLRDAVMHRLEEEAGIDLEGMRLEDVPDVAARIFEHVTSFLQEPPPELDPTLSDASRRQHAALLEAVAARAPDWSEEERTMAAAVLDVLWSVAAYERLVHQWSLDTDQAIRAVDWVIGMVGRAVGDGSGPRPRP